MNSRDLVPASLRDIPTDVVETGTILTLQSRTERQRPALGGISIGHRDITAGTLGCLVRKNGQTFILSNNHVLANSNSGSRGDPILQPGAIDGGTLQRDQIAELSEFVPILFQNDPSNCGFATAVITVLNASCRLIGSHTRYRTVRLQQQDNLVDVAIALPTEANATSPEIIGIGRIATTLGRGDLGIAVKKSGRTTGLTSGEILQVDVTVNVQFGGGRIARFTDQLLAGPMSQGGDSGSAVLDESNRLVGLLFAGSEDTTIINRIEHVFSALDLQL
ncbi:MAG: hypothetical protein RQ757_12430 [Pseudomonadales bacterium]|nr:hypothetical protein [Pseudomonadales bacterium]